LNKDEAIFLQNCVTEKMVFQINCENEEKMIGSWFLNTFVLASINLSLIVSPQVMRYEDKEL